MSFPNPTDPLLEAWYAGDWSPQGHSDLQVFGSLKESCKPHGGGDSMRETLSMESESVLVLISLPPKLQLPISAITGLWHSFYPVIGTR